MVEISDSKSSSHKGPTSRSGNANSQSDTNFFFLLVTRLKYMTLDIVELGLSALSRIASICNNAGVPMASLILLLYRPCSTHKYVELKRD